MEGKYMDVSFGLNDDTSEEEYVIACGNGGSKEDNYFDSIVGALEEILVDPEFNKLQDSFCVNNCSLLI